jgi:K+-transporting ATPase ATPase A chain
MGPLAVLPLTAIAATTRAGLAGLTTNGGPHGFTGILFAFSSSFANNGQGFAGLSANTVFYNVTTTVAMMAGRFGLAMPALALAGLFAQQGRLPVTLGTLRTDSRVFGVFLVASLVILAALCYVPALTLGPVLEHLTLFRE